MDSIANTQWLANLVVWCISFFVFLWILSIIRVSRDIIARTNSTTLQLVCILIVTILTPIIGLPIYRTIRPIQYKTHYKNNTITPWS